MLVDYVWHSDIVWELGSVMRIPDDTQIPLMPCIPYRIYRYSFLFSGVFSRLILVSLAFSSSSCIAVMYLSVCAGRCNFSQLLVVTCLCMFLCMYI